MMVNVLILLGNYNTGRAISGWQNNKTELSAFLKRLLPMARLVSLGSESGPDNESAWQISSPNKRNGLMKATAPSLGLAWLA